jgi:hypothetical protein
MKVSKILASILALMLITGVVIIPKAFAAPITVAVSPTNNIYYTSTTSIGAIFYVDIVLSSVLPADDLVGIEFKMFWDPTMLEGMNMTIPAGSIWAEADLDGNLWKTKMELNKTGGYVYYIVTCTDTDQGYTNGYLPLDTDPSGIAARICLKILVKPDRYAEISCALDLQGVLLSNGDALPISNTPVDGLYKYIWAPPVTTPYLKVNPASKSFLANPFPPYTPEFDIDIRMENLDSEWHLVGLEFKLYYNTTLLGVISVTEGPFLQGWGTTMFAKHVELDYVYVLIVLWGPYPLPSYPGGSGVVATIRFQGIYAEEFPWVGSSALDIDEVLFADDTPISIPQGTHLDGSYTIDGYILGRQLDVYTQYEDGFNGKGPYKPSDAFMPQDLVCLTAYLTYNLDPIQNKLVTFEIHSPTDVHIIYLDAITNSSGYATVCWRIPWPCPDWPEDEIFGIWNVSSTAYVANELVMDTLQFRVGWLIDLISVESYGENFYKGDHPIWKITFKTISAQDRTATFTLLLQDELLVPIGKLAIEDYLVEGTPVILGETIYIFNMTCITIPKWAYIGTATAHVNAYTEYPSLGGWAYCPEVTDILRIIRP